MQVQEQPFEGTKYKFQFGIDRGGTFTDILCEYYKPNNPNDRKDLVYKLLSVDPNHYEDAPSEGIRRIISQITGFKINKEDRIPTQYIESIRMGTTIATNALLERKGERCALLITKGFKDLLEIGNQTRPNIFDLKIERPEKIYDLVYEVNERVRIIKSEELVESADENLNLNKNNSIKTNNSNKYVKGTTGEYVEILQPMDEAEIRGYLKEICEKEIKSIAVAFVHSYNFREHEQLVKKIAMEFNFDNVSISSEIMPLVKFYPRGSTSVVDAYLTPAIYKYVKKFISYFDNSDAVKVLFMQSDGGLTSYESFFGSRAILSGPAGGVVGYSMTTSRELRNRPIIGLDMGGTSTDVSRYDHGWDHVFEIQISGVAINSPQIDVNTVAAGGGSRLNYKNGMFIVGPESAGADPGPLCYKKNGFLALTDANLILGRLIPEHFPKIFGKSYNEPLSYQCSIEGMQGITKEINQAQSINLSVEEVAAGFLKVANEAMCRPIRALTQARGFDPKDHILAIFGGAGGQHACAIAKLLGMSKVYIHKYAGILSAYGLSKSEIVEESQEPVNKILSNNDESLNKYLAKLFEGLEKSTKEKLEKMKSSDLVYKTRRYLLLSYQGSDTYLVVQERELINDYSDLLSHYATDFEKAFKREYGFLIEKRHIIIDYARVRISLVPKNLEEYINSSYDMQEEIENYKKYISYNSTSSNVFTELEPHEKTFTYFSVDKKSDDEDYSIISSISSNHNANKLQKLETKVYFWEKITAEVQGYKLNEQSNNTNSRLLVLKGPCLIQSGNSTIIIEPDCHGFITKFGNLIIDVPKQNSELFDSAEAYSKNLSENNFIIKKDPLELSLFANRFMSIAEQMGRHLQRTSVSTNIKERLDFSCALFDEEGNLVANAPHLPVHLGAMQEVVKHQINYLKENWKATDVILCNHPAAGGSHLPDMTVISPVYHNNKVVFYVANRGHHSDIGGMTPGSMPPFSKTLEDEGAAIYSFKLVESGIFQEEKVKKLFYDDLLARNLHPSRNLNDNISDLKAQVASNNKGIQLIAEMIGKYGLLKVKAYMKYIQQAAEESVKEMLDKFAAEIGIKEDSIGKSYAEDFMDDGSIICLEITIDRKNKKALFDFSGTSNQVYGNINTPKSVTYSAIIYCLRCLVDSEIPLNQGCLAPIEVKIPENSLLSPSIDSAVVGGNVTTSQRITDIVLKAFKACAASQGDMNNFTFGDEKMGYYETIGGGSGAGPGWHGKSGVQVHMTNTRITDVEIIERRYPVIIKNFSLRKHSHGKGKYNGGDGIIRSFFFLKPMKVSILSERRVFAPFGLEGGKAGQKGFNYYIKSNGTVYNIGSKNTIPVDKGDEIVIMTPGGGGYGFPEDEENPIDSANENSKLLGEEADKDSLNKLKNLHYSICKGSLTRFICDQYSN